MFGSLFGNGPVGVLSGLLRKFPIARWRNKRTPPKLDKSNKGKQNWYKGRGVGLQGMLTKQGAHLYS